MSRTRSLVLATVLSIAAGCGGEPATPEELPPDDGTGGETAAGNECAGREQECTEQGWDAHEQERWDEALRLFELTCDAGGAEACAGLAVMYINGEGVEADSARGIELLTRSCEGGHPNSCTELGVNYVRGTGVERDAERAHALFSQACEADNAKGCHWLGMVYFEGRGVARDVARATGLFERACGMGYVEGCTQQGFALLSGPQAEQHHAQIATLFGRGCSGGHAMGCGNLGVAYRDGIGVAQDQARAFNLFVQGCEGGHAASCLNAGAALVHGEGTATDLARARDLFTQACNAGEQVACDNLRQLERAGQQPAEPAGPRFSTTIGSMTVGDGAQSLAFENVRATCGMIRVMALLGSLRQGVRACLRGSATPRLSITMENGRVTEATAEPNDAAGRCAARAARAVSAAGLTCTLELTAHRP